MNYLSTLFPHQIDLLLNKKGFNYETRNEVEN